MASESDPLFPSRRRRLNDGCVLEAYQQWSEGVLAYKNNLIRWYLMVSATALAILLGDPRFQSKLGSRLEADPDTVAELLKRWRTVSTISACDRLVAEVLLGHLGTAQAVVDLQDLRALRAWALQDIDIELFPLTAEVRDGKLDQHLASTILR